METPSAATVAGPDGSSDADGAAYWIAAKRAEMDRDVVAQNDATKKTDRGTGDELTRRVREAYWQSRELARQSLDLTAKFNRLRKECKERRTDGEGQG